MLIMTNCQYCGKECKEKGLLMHEKSCKENPINKTEETKLEEKKSTEVTVPSEGQLNKVHNSFRQQLAAEEHVNIMIPPTQLYPEGSNMPICLNGVVYTIPVGIEFEKGVPKSIYNVWKESYDMDREARMKMKKVLTGVISVG
jgi:hypothetical protein